MFFVVSSTTIVIWLGIIRVKFYCFVKVCDSKVKIAFIAVSNPTIVIGLSIIRFAFYRRVMVCDGTVKILL